MPLVLRKIRKAKWWKHSDVPWLAHGDLQGDALGDLNTSDNTLSVYYVENDKSNLEQVVTALAANCQHISNLDYALLDLQAILDLDIKIEYAKGKTLDDQVNTWHIDLIELSAGKVVKLADTIFRQASIKRCAEKVIAELIREAVNSGRIDQEALQPKVLEKIQLA